MKLEKGSFNYQDSHTARLLKLLSLQSVGRLAKLEWNPANAIKDGFPYDNLRGTVELQKGVLKTENLPRHRVPWGPSCLAVRPT